MLQRFNIGQRITTFPGGTLNTLIDDYNARHSERRRISEKSPTVISQPPSSVLVRLVWVGDETPLSGGEVIVEAGSVVALGEVFDTPADNGSVPYNGLVFACDAPTAENAASCHFAILATPLHVPTSGAKAVAIGYIPNAAWAKLTINDAADEAADLVNGSTLLSSASGGRVPIVWKETGTGVKWAVVLLGGGGGGTATGAIAIIKGTVPAASAISVSGTLTESSSCVTFGTLAVNATANTFTAGALLVNPDGTPVFRDGELRAVGVLNTSLTAFEGEGDGVPIMGFVVSRTDTVEEEEVVNEYFVLPRFELRTEPGFALGSDAEDDAQGLYHSGGERDQNVGGELCE